jgi:endonuclease/exonuclease/phosphatase family metal-dependent hydrolase
LKGDRYEPRVCVVAETPEYVIASVHLDHSNDAVRVEQTEVITNDLLKRYKASRKPVFLCGDLNADPQSQTLKCFSKDWKIISRLDPTYPSDNPEECIDYILVMKNKARYKVVKTAVCTELDSVDVTGTSDHLPVFVDVVIK